MSKNMQRLADMLSTRMKQTSGAAIPTTVELGTVNSNLSITPDSLRVSIPKGDYMVNLMLTGGISTSTEGHTHSGGDHEGHASGNGSHTHSGGDHSHQLPASFRGLQPGDRILIVWCGTEPVVVAVLVSS